MQNTLELARCWVSNTAETKGSFAAKSSPLGNRTPLGKFYGIFRPWSQSVGEGGYTVLDQGAAQHSLLGSHQRRWRMQ